ncbi:MAG: hypothetical protein Phog2KO_37310 [Phototrophicaceae bacterium]
MTLKQDIIQNQAGLSIYSPDATQSQLWGHLDHHIHDKTALKPVFRQWIYHDIPSITLFYGGEVTEETRKRARHDYDKIPLSDLQYGHLVVKLFITGASLLTIWQGEDAIEQLLKVKGKTHPADSAQATVRGSLWCDNSVCNLMHSSDTPDEVLRELEALDIDNILDRKMQATDLIPKQALASNYRANSSLIIALHTINRFLITVKHSSPIEFNLAVSGDARETMRTLSPLLNAVTQDYPNTLIADFVTAYFEGDIVRLTPLLHQLPLTTWESFVMQCGTLTRKQWD